MRPRLLLALALLSCGGGASEGGAKAPSSSSGGDDAKVSQAEAAKPPAGPPVALDCGDFTTCAIAQGGEVRCWGRDKFGELGDGGGSDRARSVPVGVGGATQVKLASNFGCAVTDEKKIKCWGSGRIANDGKKLERAKPTQVSGLASALDISASGVIACARADDGITCWGADEATIGRAPKGSFKQVAAGFTHACALDGAGAVTCWGTGDWGAKGAFASPPVKGATSVATGDRHACVVKDKKVLCWGQNDAGQLGTKPDTSSHAKPAEVPGVRDAVRVVTGEASTCAILGDGSAMCWGANPEGELGLGKRSSDERPQRTSISDMTDLCLATQHGCALTKSGKIMCWGGNKHGQLGDGSTERRLSPTQVSW